MKRGTVKRRDCTCDRALATGPWPLYTAQRDAARVWVWQHLQKHPDLWFSAFELCRVLHEQYACEPGDPRRHRGRAATVEGVLAELEEAGDVVASVTGRRWRAFVPGRPVGALMRARNRLRTSNERKAVR